MTFDGIIWYPLLKFIYSEKTTKFCKIFPLLSTVCTVVKSKEKISQNFVAFSEYMNFNNRLTFIALSHPECEISHVDIIILRFLEVRSWSYLKNEKIWKINRKVVKRAANLQVVLCQKHSFLHQFNPNWFKFQYSVFYGE